MIEVIEGNAWNHHAERDEYVLITLRVMLRTLILHTDALLVRLSILDFRVGQDLSWLVSQMPGLVLAYASS